MKELLEAGVHFGHQTRRWNPKMKRFIFDERGGIYIIDLQQTQALLQEAHDFARNVAERGGTILFVGTKKQAQEAIVREATRVGQPYVAHRWLGGLLTNWRTIADRISYLQELRRLKEEGQLELLPAKERIAMAGELDHHVIGPGRQPAAIGGGLDNAFVADVEVQRCPFWLRQNRHRIGRLGVRNRIIERQRQQRGANDPRGSQA